LRKGKKKKKIGAMKTKVHSQAGEEKEGIFSGLNRKTFDTANESEYIKKFSRGLWQNLSDRSLRKNMSPSGCLIIVYKVCVRFRKCQCLRGAPIFRRSILMIFVFTPEQQKQKMQKNWDDVPEDIKNTFEKLGIPEAERMMLARSWCTV
jgi:hypothetical protein